MVTVFIITDENDDCNDNNISANLAELLFICNDLFAVDDHTMLVVMWQMCIKFITQSLHDRLI